MENERYRDVDCFAADQVGVEQGEIDRKETDKELDRHRPRRPGNLILQPEPQIQQYENGSYCDQWYMEISDRINNSVDGVNRLRSQQIQRVDHSTQRYRNCFGDGEQVTDFMFIEISFPSGSEQIRLFGFGIFEHGENVEVPVASESGEPLPVYPQSQNDLDHTVELLDEFSVSNFSGTT